MGRRVCVAYIVNVREIHGAQLGARRNAGFHTKFREFGPFQLPVTVNVNLEYKQNQSQCGNPNKCERDRGS
jgi:hypothetical protein